MRLSFTTEQGDFHTLDVAPSLTLNDLVSLIEADSNIPAASQQLYHNGSLLSDLSKTLSAANIKNDDMLLVKVKSTPQPAAARASAASSSSAAERAELLRQQILNTPALLNQIRQTNPQLVEAALNNPQRFAQLVEMAERQRQMEQAEMDLLAADPFDIEAQRQIEERIRQEQIAQNFETALEYNPEAFGRVVMLYINTEVNGKKVKAFVDSGAQATIMSPSLADECGLTHLIDKRFAGVAHGVGTAKILGRIHAAQMKIGNLFLMCSFTVMEGKGVDLLFGLDMLKRHQACIDLRKNVLTIQETDIPFLAEHELPDKAKLFEAGDPEQSSTSPTSSSTSASTSSKPATLSASSTSTASASTLTAPPPIINPGSSLPKPSERTNTTTSSSSSATATTGSNMQGTSGLKETDIQQLMSFGVSRVEAIQALQAAGGNVDVAANLLFQ